MKYIIHPSDGKKVDKISMSEEETPYAFAGRNAPKNEADTRLQIKEDIEQLSYMTNCLFVNLQPKFVKLYGINEERLIRSKVEGICSSLMVKAKKEGVCDTYPMWRFEFCTVIKEDVEEKNYHNRTVKLTVGYIVKLKYRGLLNDNEEEFYRMITWFKNVFKNYVVMVNFAVAHDSYF